MIGYRGGYNLADVATILTAALAGTADDGRAVLADLDERTRSSGGNSYWVPIATTWLGGVDAAAASSPEVPWLDGAAGALGRWAQALR